jgi:hypothetical protein
LKKPRVKCPAKKKAAAAAEVVAAAVMKIGRAGVVVTGTATTGNAIPVLEKEKNPEGGNFSFNGFVKEFIKRA